MSMFFHISTANWFVGLGALRPAQANFSALLKVADRLHQLSDKCLGAELWSFKRRHSFISEPQYPALR